MKLPQRTPVATPASNASVTSTSTKDPGVTAAAMGAYVGETVSGGSLSAGKPVTARGEPAPVQPSPRTAISPPAGSALFDSSPETQPAPASAASSSSMASDLPVVQQLEPEADPDTTSASMPQNMKPTSRPVHTKDSARADVAPDPAEPNRATEPSYDMAAVIMMPPVPYASVQAPIFLGTVAASSRSGTSSLLLNEGSRPHGAQLSGKGEPVVAPDATDNGTASPGTAGFDISLAPENHYTVTSGSRQIAATPGATDVMEPALHRTGSGANTRPLSITTSTVSVDADTTSPTAVNGVQVGLGFFIPRENTPPVKVTASIIIGNPAQAIAQQVMPALVSLATHTNGSNQLTVSLHPLDLGQVEVHLVRGNDGTTAVTVTASNPLTLQELSQNVHHLHAALDAASVPVDGRTMNFIVASTTAAEQNQGSSGRGASSPQDGSGGTSGGQDHKSWQNHQNSSNNNTVDDTATHRDGAATATRRNWQLNGLNITA